VGGAAEEVVVAVAAALTGLPYTSRRSFCIFASS